MGTRGLYVYRWQGRYHVYYNHFDSYPEGLGITLISKIPKDPEEYKKWLEQQRTRYSQVEEEVFTVKNPLDVPSPTYDNFGDIEAVPLLISPFKRGLEIWVEWIYVMDLDREMFSIISDDRQPDHYHYRFKLQSVPKNICESVQEAESYTLDEIESGEVPDFITSEILPSSEPAPEHVTGYALLNVRLVQPKRDSPLDVSDKPRAIMCEHLFFILRDEYHDTIWQAIHTAYEADVLFREVAFALLCLSTCSPNMVRLGRKSKASTQSKRYGTMNTGEFVSSFLSGFHLGGKNPGRAPAATTYWLQDVFISLERSLNCEKNCQAAIYRAARTGRDQGHAEFNAIVCSIGYVILIRVTKDRVEHTKRLKFVDLSWSEDSRGNTEDYLDEKWADNAESTHTFRAIALLMESTARKALKPLATSTCGIFPNELNQIIISHLDEATNTSCVSVSRVFRDFALDSFYMSDNVEVSVVKEQYEHGAPKKLQASHATAGTEGFPPLQIDGEGESDCAWFPIIGNADGTAQFFPTIRIELGLGKHLVRGLARNNIV